MQNGADAPAIRTPSRTMRTCTTSNQIRTKKVTSASAAGGGTFGSGLPRYGSQRRAAAGSYRQEQRAHAKNRSQRSAGSARACCASISARVEPHQRHARNRPGSATSAAVRSGIEHGRGHDQPSRPTFSATSDDEQPCRRRQRLRPAPQQDDVDYTAEQCAEIRKHNAGRIVHVTRRTSALMIDTADCADRLRCQRRARARARARHGIHAREDLSRRVVPVAACRRAARRRASIRWRCPTWRRSCRC